MQLLTLCSVMVCVVVLLHVHERGQVSLMLFTADEETDRYLCCGLIPKSKAAKKDANKWVQVRAKC